jgi:ADP-ribose pyrophosphatase
VGILPPTARRGLTQPAILSRNIEYSCDWFDVIAKRVLLHERRREETFYSIRTNDYTAVLAITEEGLVPLVRQFRPAVETCVLELPSGAVEIGEDPELATKRELAEETGCEADTLVPLGCLHSDSGRMQTRQWAFFALGARVAGPPTERDEQLELLFIDPHELPDLVQRGEFRMALHLGVVCLALMAGLLEL